MKKTTKKVTKKTNKFPSELKDEIITALYDPVYEGMFGGGMEAEYVMEGVNFIGLSYMSDKELTAEMEIQGMSNKRDPCYELYMRAKKALGDT